MLLNCSAQLFGRHSVGRQTAWPDFAADPAMQSAVHVLAFGGKIGVDVFVLITGYFMIKSRFKSRSFLRTVTETWFYSWTLLAMFLLAGWGISKTQAFESIAPIVTGEYWFITTYLVLYLFIPLLNRVMGGMSRGSQRLLIAIAFVVFSLLPTVTTYNPVSENLPWFFFLYLLGGYIRLSENDGEAPGTGPARSVGPACSSSADRDGCDRAAFGSSGASARVLHVLNPSDLVRRHPLAWCLGSFAVIIGSIIVLTYAYSLNGFSFLWWSTFILQHKVPALLMAVSMFWLFKRMPMPYIKAVNAFGAATFGVYLIHEQQFVRMWLWGKVLFLTELGPVGLVLGGLAICAAVYLVCSLVDIVRKHVVEDPFMRFVERRFGPRLDRIDEVMALK